jgi:ABC-2 type transport system ATP-binding protein
VGFLFCAAKWSSDFAPGLTSRFLNPLFSANLRALLSAMLANQSHGLHVMPVSPAIQLDGVTKLFGSVKALDDVSVSVQQGEVVAMLGPNGAGKTTAVSIMLGLRRPTQGAARLFGADPRHPAARLRLGAMLQDSGVPVMLTVSEVVQLFSAMYHRPIAPSEAIDAAQLGDKRNARVATLSGGQRQRLYFAVAIVGDPDVLFLDEPTVGLDAEARRAFWEQITRLTARGKTVLLTTHYLEEADALANRVVVINRGGIVAEGSPSAIKTRVGGRSVRFTAEGLSQEWLAGLPGVQRVSRTGSTWNLLSIEPERALREIFANGATISGLEVQGAGLEEAVLALLAAGSAGGAA